MEKKTLLIIFCMNFAFFVIELATGIISNSVGLITDSADMFVDAMVYFLSLFAIGKVAFKKKRIAYFQCVIQTILLCALGFEVIRRFLSDTPLPDYEFMIAVSSFAFLANITSYFLLRRLRSKDVNIKVSEICSRMDCFINLGIIFAGVLVLILGSKLPDLIIGSLILIYAVKELVEMYRNAHKGEVGCGCAADCTK